MIGKGTGTDQEGAVMKRLDILAAFAVAAMVFVALLLEMLAPKNASGPEVQPASPPRPLSLCKTFLETTIAGSFGAFKNACFKEGNGQMKLFAAQPSTKEMFRRAAKTIAPVCRQGYDLQYLDSMKQQGSEVFLWKLVPGEGDSEFLVRLTLEDGKVSGFFFQ